MLRKIGIIAVLSLLVTAFAAVPALAAITTNITPRMPQRVRTFRRVRSAARLALTSR